MASLLPDVAGAVFSDCGRYRYRLWRRWGTGAPCVYLMLNPSTADEVDNDPTVERCERRARKGGFGGLEVVNLFAIRATDPKVMLAAADPVGPENDAAILEATDGAGLVVAAWGVHGAHRGRGEAVRRLLAGAGRRLHCLSLTKEGHPRHPLYVGYMTKPRPWEAASDATDAASAT